MIHFILTLTLLASASARPDLGPIESCPGNPEKGPCNRNIFKWAFDHERRECITFIWGGCGGNDKNRFESEKQCIEKCFASLGENYYYKLDLDLICKIPEKNETAVQNISVIPKEKRGPKLTFQETGTENTFMFAQSNTFIQIDGDIIQTFQLR